MDIETILRQFQLRGHIKSVQPFGNGHINDSFRVVNEDAHLPDYLLQRINREVFPDALPLMENIRLVSEHIQRKSPGASLQLIPTLEGQAFWEESSGTCWRVYLFRKELHSVDVATSNDQIYEGAKAFGRFLALLADFPAARLSITLPDFHHVGSRLQQFREAQQADVLGRVSQAGAEIQAVWEMADEMGSIQRAGEAGKLPLRVLHNDTKFNNVLLDAQGKGRCVIDLETVMPGYVPFDFGDGVRTTVSHAAEDEVDLSQIQVELDRFEAFARGYLSETASLLTPNEINYLPPSPALLAYLMGVRFLTDYLAGDRYYHIHFESHNLQRAKAQLTLARRLMERLPELRKITQSCLSR